LTTRISSRESFSRTAVRQRECEALADHGRQVLDRQVEHRDVDEDVDDTLRLHLDGPQRGTRALTGC